MSRRRGALGEVAFLEELEAARHRQQRLHVGGDEVFALAKADDQRAGNARARPSDPAWASITTIA